MNFPIYVKYPDGNTLLKLESREVLIELKVLGKKVSVNRFEAKIFSDRIYIQDLIVNVENGLLSKISEEEFNALYRDTDKP